ncbi:MAG: AAA family ATPase [Proteobacteria bacterium]|nr:AAA family ATPase [Pseudomonadota bacterium]
MVSPAHRLTDFELSLKKGLYTVDRTPYIEKYEKANEPFVICLRPRGFDKCLLLSTLFYFYSNRLSKISRKLFHQLYISNFQPIIRSSYSILYLDFSSIAPDNPVRLQADYKAAIEYAIQEYCHFESVAAATLSGLTPIQLLREFLKTYGQEKLFVLINEYDGFHYEILDPALNRFESKQIGSNPLIGVLYNELKQAIHLGCLGRIFVAGTDDSQDR